MKKTKKAFHVGFRGKKILVKNYILCDSTMKKARGLMFRGKNFDTPLVFLWKKPGKYAIHSFFCRRFMAVWLIDGKTIEMKTVKPWKLSIKPAKKFDTLIEIPLK